MPDENVRDFLLLQFSLHVEGDMHDVDMLWVSSGDGLCGRTLLRALVVTAFNTVMKGRWQLDVLPRAKNSPSSRVIRFPNTFKENPDPGKPNEKLRDPSLCRKVKELAPHLMRMLIERHKQYVKDGRPNPVLYPH